MRFIIFSCWRRSLRFLLPLLPANNAPAKESQSWTNASSSSSSSSASESDQDDDPDALDDSLPSLSRYRSVNSDPSPSRGPLAGLSSRSPLTTVAVRIKTPGQTVLRLKRGFLR
ncbi:hypothetical protein BV898_17633 [Hypsibius exemplaris]|uniref:Secreted protein n=1 Tax=Hypsibius exemplaris TaxID=2072580 RepID=A0A9X6NFY0_HYPEX|nr:hypothetical protein BV898_17633 [Hypsibius exemplaris]